MEYPKFNDQSLLESTTNHQNMLTNRYGPGCSKHRWPNELIKRLTHEVFYEFINKYIDIFVEKMRECFAMQKLLTFFQQKYWHISDIMFEILTRC